MSNTDELRRLFDMRGVKHKDEDTLLDTHGTLYRVTTTDDWVYEEPPGCDLLVRSRYDIGAEEAAEVEATLGRGTCDMEFTQAAQFGDLNDEDSIFDVGMFRCTACGTETYGMWNDNDECREWPRFCPNCGRKVES